MTKAKMPVITRPNTVAEKAAHVGLLTAHRHYDGGHDLMRQRGGIAA